MHIFTISGLDGSGKSTQIEKLKSYLESQGKKVFYFHAGQFSISKTYNILRPHKVISGRHKESVAKANIFQVYLRRFALMIDILRFKCLLKKLEKQGYDYLGSDRYFYDNIINIKFLSKNPKKLPCEKFIPKPDVAIYLSADPEKIMERERKPDQGLEYLKAKKELLDADYPNWNLKLIDGNRSQGEVFEEISSLISNF